MDLSKVKKLQIPEGKVKEITINGVTVWKEPIAFKILNKMNGDLLGSSYQYQFAGEKPDTVTFIPEKGNIQTSHNSITYNYGRHGTLTADINGLVTLTKFKDGPALSGTYDENDKIVFSCSGIEDSDIMHVIVEIYICVKKGSKVKLFDGTVKNIEDVNYNDKLLCWDFNNGRPTFSKPIWIMKKKQATKYNKLSFSDGSTLCTINQHRIFNKEKGKFTYPMTEDTPIGTTTLNSRGDYVQLINKEEIVEDCEYYNVITDKTINLFVDNILTSCRLSNMYSINNLKYVKDNCSPRNTEDLSSLPTNYIEGLCLREQPVWSDASDGAVNFGNSLVEYVQHLLKEEVNVNVN